jgi:hypothetical protein
MFLKRFPNMIKALGLSGIAFFAANATADIAFSAPQTLSENSSANKTKLVRLGNGWLVSAYGDANGPEVYDTKADDTRLARDVYVKACHPAFNDSQCSDPGDWSAAINLSNSAALTSIATGWNEEAGVDVPVPFYGDAEKPNIFVAGSFAVVTWVSKYCPGGKQRLISYDERESLSVPFSCLYASYTNNVAGVDGEAAQWNTLQLTDGTRDAKSDFNKGLSVNGKGLWTISWQEDPRGLQLGGGEGPGEGASGANVTKGTDVWYTYTEDIMATPFSVPVRITDNYTSDGSGGNTSPIFDPNDYNNEIETLERGNTGSSRPNLMLVGGSPVPTAVIAYEESKGADRLDSGKLIRYHEFPFNNPPASAGLYANGEPGCIISDPRENSRRVRFVAQANASAHGLRLGVFWRHGFPTEGGPGDIMVRTGIKTDAEGSTGLRPEDMQPSVDAGCRESDYLVARELANSPASNISSNTIPWSPIDSELPDAAPANVLTDTSSFNPYEDAKAHRAAIVGDDLYIGFSYAKDWAVATVIDLDNYNFWLRRYNAAGLTNDTYDQGWTLAKNVSNITDVKIQVKEPRLVKTPGSGMGCNVADPSSSVYPENCQSQSTLIVGWGTESNVYGHIGGSQEGEIYYSRTTDKGVTFEEPTFVANIGDNNRFESQLRPSPAGNIVWTVWNETVNPAGGTNANISVTDESDETTIVPTPAPGGGTPPPPLPGSDVDMALLSLVVPSRVSVGTPQIVVVRIANNDATSEAAGTVTVQGISSRGDVVEFNNSFSELVVNGSLDITFDWTAPARPTTFNWTATVNAEGDTDTSNNSATGLTRVRR